jgi:hypothetical protein
MAGLSSASRILVVLAALALVVLAVATVMLPAVHEAVTGTAASTELSGVSAHLSGLLQQVAIALAFVAGGGALVAALLVRRVGWAVPYLARFDLLPAFLPGMG